MSSHTIPKKAKELLRASKGTHEVSSHEPLLKQLFFARDLTCLHSRRSGTGSGSGGLKSVPPDKTAE